MHVQVGLPYVVITAPSALSEDLPMGQYATHKYWGNPKAAIHRILTMGYLKKKTEGRPNFFKSMLSKSQIISSRGESFPDDTHKRKPILRVDTVLANEFHLPPALLDSPPLTARDRQEIPTRRRKDSVNSLNQRSKPLTPPPTPSSGSPKSRVKVLGSLFSGKSERQRRLAEIRAGKLPARLSDERESTSTSDNSSILELWDPSSSTTYSPWNRSSRGCSSDDGVSSMNSLR
jgi:hypothetical protein